MIHNYEDLQYCKTLFKRFYGIGALPGGGVTRLGYTKEEDLMHKELASAGEELGFNNIEDEAGNTYICNSVQDNYYLIGSHLDSVVEGGRYDGAAGIIAGLMILKWAKEDCLNEAIRVGAFRCEESSRFGHCTIGSGLITKKLLKNDAEGLVSSEGKLLWDIFEEKGYSLEPQQIRGIRQYLELHIEQGRLLEETKTRVGIVNTIAGPKRYNLYFYGLSEHSGATPMMIRQDALCSAAESILEIEKIGIQEAVYHSVTTVGVVNNRPNVMNVIPGEVRIGIDIRGIDIDSINRIEENILERTRSICRKRNIKLIEEKLGEVLPVEMSKDLQVKLESVANDLGISSRIMMSGAGHDAMSFADICDTAMIFIPCRGGISHNKMEFTDIESICDGARIMYEHIRRDRK